ncbi:DUF1850 domain-containing protein [Limnochorda pilosa]|uniref:DUF1850 domain-containing protein n=1 Tax=Limnochorda pilosa TaxID=1555112 RepID=A0A0K2SHC0_LIMPI|nr:DUF1850 domain-containing protein [Limnochorda pilosa]BAS26513.1 hypothetical protein LIP_0656 [Limnochorda pilosa]
MLRLSDGRAAEVLLQVPVRPGQPIRYGYTHSSDRTPVEDLFTVTPSGGLRLVEERYRWYGVGLEYHSQASIREEDGQVVVTVNRTLGRLPLRVAATVDQWLEVGPCRWRLGDLAPPGAAVVLEVHAGSEP